MNEDARAIVADGIEMASDGERACNAVLAATHSNSDDRIAGEQRRHLRSQRDIARTRGMEGRAGSAQRGQIDGLEHGRRRIGVDDSSSQLQRKVKLRGAFRGATERKPASRRATAG